jgi:hypothetical protein
MLPTSSVGISKERGEGTNETSEVFEDVGLEAHVDVHCADDVAEVTHVDV